MIIKHKKLTIPEYRERKEIFELLGYEEISYKEKGTKAIVTLQIDESTKHYQELVKLERQIYRKGPPFFPIILFVVGSFVLLSMFVIFLAISWKDKTTFDIDAYAIGLLLPAFLSLLGCVIYTYFYFSINRFLLDKGKISKDQIKEMVNKIKNK